MLPLQYGKRRACCIGAQRAHPIKLNPVQERLGRRVERAPDHGALGPVQEECVVHDAGAALHASGVCPGKASQEAVAVRWPTPVQAFNAMVP